jgi:Putative sensor
VRLRRPGRAGALRALLGTRLPPPFRPLPRGPVLARVWARAADPALWRGLLYLLLLLPTGLAELVVVFVLAFSAVLVSYPL